jgi:hypothetical protein
MAAKNEGVKGLRPRLVGELFRSSSFLRFTGVRGTGVLGSSHGPGLSSSLKKDGCQEEGGGYDKQDRRHDVLSQSQR